MEENIALVFSGMGCSMRGCYGREARVSNPGGAECVWGVWCVGVVHPLELCLQEAVFEEEEAREGRDLVQLAKHPEREPVALGARERHTYGPEPEGGGWFLEGRGATFSVRRRWGVGGGGGGGTHQNRDIKLC